MSSRVGTGIATSSSVSPPPVPREDDDPDTYLAEASVAEVRAFERRTRQNVETRKKELRAMVGEQYLDLIAAADTIIDMNKKAKLIQQHFERMQESCNIHAIQKQASQVHITDTKELPQDQKRRELYVLASLIKSLADVPEQIWHALEGHQYLQAGCLYTLAKQVHEYLETNDSFMVDIDVAFPVIQRQWDAISFFGPQIIRRSIHHLRAFVLPSEEVAKVLVGLMQMDKMTIKGTFETLLDMRKQAIDELIQQSIKQKFDAPDQLLSRLLRDIAHIIQRTLIHIHNIYLPPGHNLLTDYAEKLRLHFTMSSDLSTTSTTATARVPTVGRLFSPSTNAHLLIRYLPQEIQQYTVDLDIGNKNEVIQQEITKMTTQWLEENRRQLNSHLATILQPITTTEKLLEIRARLWDLLHDYEYGDQQNTWTKISQELLATPHYSIYHTMFRSSFNTHAKHIIDIECDAIANQPHQVIWPLIADSPLAYSTKKAFQIAPAIWPTLTNSSDSDGNVTTAGNANISHFPEEAAFSLPQLSSSSAIISFKKALTAAATEQTPLLREMLEGYDKAWSQLRADVICHLTYRGNHFHADIDVNDIEVYFQQQCEKSNLKYIANLHELFEKLKQWPDQNSVIGLLIWIGRLARMISEESKELLGCLTFSFTKHQGHSDILELKSGVGKNPRYEDMQQRFFAAYRSAHDEWIKSVSNHFEHQLSSILNSTTWNDQCPSLSIWENVGNGEEKDIVLPTMTTNATEKAIFNVCEGIQRIHSTRLDKMVLQTLCQALHEKLVRVLELFLDKQPSISEKGALQLLFDVCFLDRILQDRPSSIDSLSFTTALKQKIDPINWAVFGPYYDSNVERFYLKQTLLVGVLVRTNSDTFERTRKSMTGNQQYNVLPLAAQVQRFTLLPIGHGTSIRIR